jgi:hypothetical protein
MKRLELTNTDGLEVPEHTGTSRYVYLSISKEEWSWKHTIIPLGSPPVLLSLHSACAVVHQAASAQFAAKRVLLLELIEYTYYNKEVVDTLSVQLGRRLRRTRAALRVASTSYCSYSTVVTSY